MNKETSSRVSTIAARIMREQPTELQQVQPGSYNTLLAEAKTLAASCMSQDEHPGQAPRHEPSLVDRLLTEREALQEKHEKLLLFLDGGATGASAMQRHLLSLQLCAMTNYGDALDRRLEDFDFPTGDLEPFCGPGINNVGMENVDGE